MIFFIQRLMSRKQMARIKGKFSLDDLKYSFGTKNTRNIDGGEDASGEWYRFYDMAIGGQAVIHFLADHSEENPLLFSDSQNITPARCQW